jgi:phage shock protein PspC (stress-responsive transcriptional regulator)
MPRPEDDPAPMTEKQPTPPKKTPKPKAQAAPQGPPRLLRSTRERMLTGVAGGISERLGVDPTYVRLGFVAAALFGGFGVLAYLILAVVVPEDDGTGQPVTGRRPPTWAIAGLAIALLLAIPGGLWGGHGWWWGWAGPFWLVLLGVGGIVAVRRLRRDKPAASATPEAKTPPGSSATAETAVMDMEDGAPRRGRTDVGRALLLVIAVAAGIAVAGVIAVLSMWAAATGHGAIVAGLVIALGIGIAAAALLDNRALAPWLLGAALLLAVPAGAIAATDVHFDGGIGERDYHPAQVSDIPADGYELGIGQLVVDLRDIPWQKGQTIPVKSDLGIGQMIVSVPENVCVVTDASAKAGELVVRGSADDGVDVQTEQNHPTGKAPRLELDGSIQFGQVVVTDQDPDVINHVGPGERKHDEGNDPDEQQRQKEACAA